MDSYLKKIFITVGWILCLALTFSSVRALKIWLANMETALRSEEETSKLLLAFQELNVSVDFLGEASIEVACMPARTMSHSLTARRALWLCHWTANLASKQELCIIPFEGKVLFGKHLEEAISKVTEGKSGLLPQI